jgi:hypothetical protein
LSNLIKTLDELIIQTDQVSFDCKFSHKIFEEGKLLENKFDSKKSFFAKMSSPKPSKAFKRNITS